MLLVGFLALVTFQESVTVWMIYVIALVFGLADAFMFPASSAFPPRLLPRDQLAAGNSLIQGAVQVTLVLGPLLAGVLIAGLGDSTPGGLDDARGLALVFGLDAVSFLVPIGILLVIRDQFPPPDTGRQPIWSALVDGLRYLWNDLPLRTLAVLLGALSLFFRGPFFVGVPAFADAYLGDGAAGFGTIIAAIGVGSIFGTILHDPGSAYLADCGRGHGGGGAGRVHHHSADHLDPDAGPCGAAWPGDERRDAGLSGPVPGLGGAGRRRGRLERHGPPGGRRPGHGGGNWGGVPAPDRPQDGLQLIGGPEAAGVTCGPGGRASIVTGSNPQAVSSG
jgi:hypothetical protein